MVSVLRERGGGERGTGSVMSRVWPDMARPGRQDTRPGPAGAHLNMVKHVCLLSGSTEVLGSLQLKRERERERQRPRLEVPPRPVRPAPDPPPLNEQGRLASALLANAARATSQSAFQNFFFFSFKSVVDFYTAPIARRDFRGVFSRSPTIPPIAEGKEEGEGARVHVARAWAAAIVDVEKDSGDVVQWRRKAR